MESQQSFVKVGSIQILNFSGLLTRTKLDTHLVGSVTGVMMPSLTSLSSSSFKRSLRATGTFLGGCTTGLTASSTSI